MSVSIVSVSFLYQKMNKKPPPKKIEFLKHRPPETTAVSVCTRARTSWLWFLKVLVLTH